MCLRAFLIWHWCYRLQGKFKGSQKNLIDELWKAEKRCWEETIRGADKRREFGGCVRTTG